MASSFTGRARFGALCCVLSAVILGAGCGDDDDGPFGDERCRFDPASCPGGPGAFCDRDSDCQTGYCCRDGDHCGGGMCTYTCDRDEHCPPDMGCEHGACFYYCRSEGDCARGQSCEHGNSVCEW